jgi:TRAP-type C4-dicarboxylate transport system substrate-binding protein
MKFHEVQKYINMTSHVTNANFYLINAKLFNGLAKEYQDILLGAFDEGGKLIVNLLNDDDKNLGEEFRKAGVTLHQPDLDSFRKATASMPEKFVKWWIRYGEDLHSRIANLK